MKKSGKFFRSPARIHEKEWETGIQVPDVPERDPGGSPAGHRLRPSRYFRPGRPGRIRFSGRMARTPPRVPFRSMPCSRSPKQGGHFFTSAPDRLLPAHTLSTEEHGPAREKFHVRNSFFTVLKISREAPADIRISCIAGCYALPRSTGPRHFLPSPSRGRGGSRRAGTTTRT